MAGKPPKSSSQHSKLQKHTALAVSVLKVPVSRGTTVYMGERRRKGQLKG